MLNIVLLAPEIPQNTGNIGRLCVNTGSRLHLIKPLGFSLSAAQVRRAGLDYWHHLDVAVYENWADFTQQNPDATMLFLSTKGTETIYRTQYSDECYLVFGNESSGLPPELYETYRSALRAIPMPGAGARSLNLANSVAVVLFEALRQINGW